MKIVDFSNSRYYIDFVEHVYFGSRRSKITQFYLYEMSRYVWEFCGHFYVSGHLSSHAAIIKKHFRENVQIEF